MNQLQLGNHESRTQSRTSLHYNYIKNMKTIFTNNALKLIFKAYFQIHVSKNHIFLNKLKFTWY